MASENCAINMITIAWCGSSLEPFYIIHYTSISSPYFKFLIIKSVAYNISRSFSEHLNVTIFLGASIISSPVAGFLPLRSFFCLTSNFPDPLMNTSLPFSKVSLMVSDISALLFKKWKNKACGHVRTAFGLSLIREQPYKVGSDPFSIESVPNQSPY